MGYQKKDEQILETGGAVEIENGNSAVFSAAEMLRTVNEIISLSLGPFQAIAIKELKCKSSYEKDIQFHFHLTLYIADVSKCEDILAVRHCTQNYIALPQLHGSQKWVQFKSFWI